MDHNERADELEREAERLEQESEKLGDSTGQARSEWEQKKSDPSKAPGAGDPESTGPHHIEAEDPASGKRYGEKRQEEIDEAVGANSDDEENGEDEEDGDNDST
jgi:hypothetical protein